MVSSASSQLDDSFRKYFGVIEDPRSRDCVYYLFHVLFLSV